MTQELEIIDKTQDKAKVEILSATPVIAPPVPIVPAPVVPEPVKQAETSTQIVTQSPVDEAQVAIEAFVAELKASPAMAEIVALAKSVKKENESLKDAIKNVAILMAKKEEKAIEPVKVAVDVPASAPAPDVLSAKEVAKDFMKEIEKRDEKIEKLSKKLVELEELTNRGVKKAVESLSADTKPKREYVLGSDGWISHK